MILRVGKPKFIETETGENQSQEYAQYIYIFSLKGMFMKNSSWQAKPSPHATVTLYGDCVKMC
jgi:hypothetical protein